MRAFSAPRYYEIAYAFIDPGKQVDLFEQFARKYSTFQPKRFLDICCGPSLQLRELARRGYEVVGLDESPAMLKYLEERASELGVTIHTICSSLVRFRIRPKAHFAFIMMGSIAYLRSNDEFLSHLNSVAHSLESGGLYLIENMRLNWAEPDFFKPQRWVRSRGGVRVKATYCVSLEDTLSQMLTETLILEVDDHGRKSVLEERRKTKMIFPQEYLALIDINGKFDFLGWFERHTVRPLRKADLDNIALLRRK